MAAIRMHVDMVEEITFDVDDLSRQNQTFIYLSARLVPTDQKPGGVLQIHSTSFATASHRCHGGGDGPEDGVLIVADALQSETCGHPHVLQVVDRTDATALATAMETAFWMLRTILMADRARVKTAAVAVATEREIAVD